MMSTSLSFRLFHPQRTTIAQSLKTVCGSILPPETGDRLYDIGIDWTEVVHFYNADPHVKYESTVYTDYLSREDLVKWHTYFEKKYKPTL